MKFPHCPEMEQLGLQLIEAYRRNEEHQHPEAETPPFPSEEVIAVHHAITQHRVTCPICNQIDYNQANAHIDRLITN
jgi:hypothetical protein